MSLFTLPPTSGLRESVLEQRLEVQDIQDVGGGCGRGVVRGGSMGGEPRAGSGLI